MFSFWYVVFILTSSTDAFAYSNFVASDNCMIKKQTGENVEGLRHYHRSQVAEKSQEALNTAYLRSANWIWAFTNTKKNLQIFYSYFRSFPVSHFTVHILNLKLKTSLPWICCKNSKAIIIISATFRCCRSSCRRNWQAHKRYVSSGNVSNIPRTQLKLTHYFLHVFKKIILKTFHTLY